MKRKLLRQMTTEWRQNIWIVTGLTIITLAVWLFCSSLYSTMEYYFMPLGFDESDVYVVDVATLDEEAPGHIDYGEEQGAKDSDDLRALVARIKNSPHVEYVAYSINGAPYQLSAYNSSVSLAIEELDTLRFSANFRHISPEGVKVLRLQSLTDKDEGFLYEKLASGEILVSPDPTYNPATQQSRWSSWNNSHSHAAKDFVGRKVYFHDDSVTTYRVADEVALIRRTGFERGSNGGVILPINPDGNLSDVDNLMIRVKPGQGKKFVEEFGATPEMIMNRNIYLQELTSLSAKGESVNRDDVLNVRLYIFLISFLVLILFLGLLGTFWFRMQQRVGEIAIRRVCGATRRSIFGRVIGEGMVLLCVATLLAAAIGWFLIKRLDMFDGYTTSQLIYFELGAAVVVMAGIILSLLYPAWRAMSIEPALAVKDE